MKFLPTKKSKEGWSVGFGSSRYHEFVPGTPYEAWGIALLWYRPERRLSLSLWFASLIGIGGWSTNIRLWEPRKLSWER